MPIAKHLIVENGVLKVTDKARPVEPMPDQDGYFSSHHQVDLIVYNKALESWKQEALVVSPSFVGRSPNTLHIGNDTTFEMPDIDGIYDAPAGLEYEVVCKGMMKENCHNDEECWDKNNCLSKQRVAILSFASPKEETPNCNHKFVTRVDGRMVCSFCGAIGFIDFASPEETPASKEKPDFEKMASEWKGDFSTYEKGLRHGYSLIETRLSDMCREYGLLAKDRDKQIAALQEERDRIKIELSNYAYQMDMAKRERDHAENKNLELQEEIRQLKNKQ